MKIMAICFCKRNRVKVKEIKGLRENVLPVFALASNVHAQN